MCLSECFAFNTTWDTLTDTLTFFANVLVSTTHIIYLGLYYIKWILQQDYFCYSYSFHKNIIIHIHKWLFIIYHGHSRFLIAWGWMTEARHQITRGSHDPRAGVGVTKPISTAPLYSPFSIRVKTLVMYWMPLSYWTVLPQINYRDTRQIWKWFKEPSMYFSKLNFFNGEINERNFNNSRLKVFLYTWHLV